MKLYHEIATIKEGNARVGYIMKAGDVFSVGKFYIASQYQFNKTVQEGKVQYFEWNAETNSPYVSYTEEELKQLQKVGMFKPVTGKEYWDNDVVIRKRYIDALEKGTILIIPLQIVKIPIVGVNVSVLIFGMSSLVEQFYQSFIIPYFSNSAALNTVKFGGNNLSISMPIYDLESERFILYARKCYNDILIEYGNLERKKDKKLSLLQKLDASEKYTKVLLPHLKKYSLEG